VRLLRPTDQRGDHSIALGERGPGIYEGTATDVTAGVWDAEIEAARASERLFRSHNRIVMK
jgi:nitrogen fixation protein FixH